jgi:hypothetical protein
MNRAAEKEISMNKANIALMTSIVAAMAVEATPFLMATPKQVEKLLADGMVEQNPDIKDGDKVATRATEKGITALNEATAGPSTGADGAPAASPFAIIKNAVLPTARGGRSSVLYPFDDMEAGDSFFIPATVEKPNPAKSLASTVSAATKKFAEDTGQTKVTPKGNTIAVLKNTRVFSVKAVKGGVALGEFTPPSDGALVQRTA